LALSAMLTTTTSRAQDALPSPTVDDTSIDVSAARALDAPIATETGVFAGRRARRFSLLVGMGFTAANGGRGQSILPELGFYTRVSEWVSIGLRLRGGAGYSSGTGAHVRLAMAMPSVRTHFREDLSSLATIELGVHADGGLALEWFEDAALRADWLSFGVGAGVYATLELGDTHALTLDASMTAYGLAGTAVSIEMGATLSYVVRWD